MRVILEIPEEVPEDEVPPEIKEALLQTQNNNDDDDDEGETDNKMSDVP